MTIVCAIYDTDAGKVWLGCNSSQLLNGTVMPEHKTKWLRFTNWAVAFSTSGIAHDVLETERAKFPNQTSEISQVMSFIRTAFDKFGLGETKDGVRDYNVSGLVAHTSGAIFNVDTRLSVSRIPEGTMWACGSGMEFALGADGVLKLKGFSVQERIESAVFTAIDLDSRSPGEPIIESIG